MHNWKKLLALLMALTMLAALIPFGAGAEEPEKVKEEVRVMTAGDYVTADRIFEQIYAIPEAETMSTVSRAEAVYNLVSAADGVVSVRMNGDRVEWMTEDGVACAWSPRMEEIGRNAEPADFEAPESEVLDFSTKGNHGMDVYLVEPYYGIDTSFTRQYQTEGQRLAQVTGGTYTLKTQSAATIDFVAQAIQDGGIVIFDSHGDTDYANGDDYTSGAKTSYLCLQSGTGITNADYTYDSAKGVYHANYLGYSGSGSRRMYFYEVDGTAIANHMTGNSENGLLWSAICLGMATDGMQAPLRAKGLEVAYGYSQSVTFAGDYCWEDTFFDSLCDGKTVAEAINDMKIKWGKWDWSVQIASYYGYSDGYTTEAAARADYSAFPIVVSNEDVYPGHGNVDTVQDVYSTWTMFPAACSHNFEIRNAREATCTSKGYTGDSICTICNEIQSMGEVIPPLGHDLDDGVVTTKPTPSAPGIVTYTCARCGYALTEEIPPVVNPFTDVHEGDWYFSPVLWAAEMGITSGVTETEFDPNGSCTRGQVVTFLWRAAGCPAPAAAACAFSDVTENDYFFKPVMWAVENGITTGMGDGTFGAVMPCTRAQVVTFLWRANGSPAVGGSAYFSDVSSSDYFYDAVLWAVENGITTGTGDGTFAPFETCTRAQVVTFLFRAK